jgi:polar amino acid transport system substrate-binding protein
MIINSLLDTQQHKRSKKQEISMRRTGSIIILLLTLVLLSSCSHKTGPFFLFSASPVLDRILQRGELIVGTAGSMPPLNMTTRAGEIIGLEADLAGHMARAMGVGLKLKAMPFSDLIPALEAGSLDMVISGLTITPQRNLKVAFAGPYLISGKAVLTKIERLVSANDPSVIDQRDIAVAALKGSTSQEFVEKRLPKAKLVATQNYDQAVAMVIDGKVDALIADFPICIVSVLRYSDQGLYTLIDPFTYEPLGIAVPANDPLLINWVQNFLSTLEGSGESEALKSKWFKDASWLKLLP